MKNMARAFLLLLVLGGLTFALPEDSQAKKILKKNLQFLGGKEKMAEVKSLQIDQVNSRFKKAVYTFAFPDKFRHQVSAHYGSLIFLASEKKGAIVDLSPQGKTLRVEYLNPGLLKELRYYAREFIFPLIVPLEEEFKTVRFLETKKISSGLLKGRTVNILEIQLKSGDRYEALFSKSYHFLLMLRSILPYGKEKGKMRTVFYEDYREVQGIMVPHKIYMRTTGGPKKILNLKIKINPKVSRDFWNIPTLSKDK